MIEFDRFDHPYITFPVALMITEGNKNVAIGASAEVRDQCRSNTSPMSEAVDNVVGASPATDPSDAVSMTKDLNPMSDESRPFLKGKKYAILMSIVTALMTLDTMGTIKTASRIWQVAGIAVGDGSDGYAAYADYVKAQSLWENAMKTYAVAHEKSGGDTTSISMLDEMERLQEARQAFRIAQKHFVSQLKVRTAKLSDGERTLLYEAAEKMTVPSPKPNISQATRKPQAEHVTFVRK